MKYMDKVKVINMKKEYEKNNVYLGRIGRIIDAEIRDNCFHVAFDTGRDDEWYDFASITIEDLEVVEESDMTDDNILSGIPLNNPKWWCKVEDGYIVNLLGEKKNKIPYDYNS